MSNLAMLQAKRQIEPVRRKSVKRKMEDHHSQSSIPRGSYIEKGIQVQPSEPVHTEQIQKEVMKYYMEHQSKLEVKIPSSESSCVLRQSTSIDLPKQVRPTDISRLLSKYKARNIVDMAQKILVQNKKSN